MDQLQFLHSTYKSIKIDKNNSTDGLIICAKDVNTGESKIIEMIEPERTMYTVKPGLRREFNIPREVHRMEDLDTRRVKHKDIVKALAKQFNMWSSGYIDARKVMNHPYSAGNDIPIDVLVKQEMNSKLPRTAARYRVGALDIETDIVTGSNAILCITYVSDDHEVFLGILKSFLKGQEDIVHIENVCKEKVAEFVATLNKSAKKQYDDCPVTKYNINICTTEVQLIKWIFDMIHKKKDDVLSIWNMIFDMETMLNRLDINLVDPAEIMCHHDVSRTYRECKLVPDKTPVTKLGHHTYRWDFMHLSGYTQPIDSMCLFSRLRKVKGLKSSYSLGNIAAETIGSTKMDFGNDGHYEMQTTRQVEYCAYNIIDSLILTLQDKVTNDVSSMFLLTQNTVLPAFAKQTVQLSHSFFKYLKEKNMVPGSCLGDVSLIMDVASGVIKPYGSWFAGMGEVAISDALKAGHMVNVDNLIENTGGGVLNPLLTHDTGVPLLEESNDNVNVAIAVGDLDVELIVSSIL